jgi:hypothetical protein
MLRLRRTAVVKDNRVKNDCYDSLIYRRVMAAEMNSITRSVSSGTVARLACPTKTPSGRLITPEDWNGLTDEFAMRAPFGECSGGGIGRRLDYIVMMPALILLYPAISGTTNWPLTSLEMRF